VVVAAPQLPDVAGLRVVPLRLGHDRDALVDQFGHSLVVGCDLGAVVAGALGDVVELAHLHRRHQRLHHVGVVVEFGQRLGLLQRRSYRSAAIAARSDSATATVLATSARLVRVRGAI